MAKRHVGSGTYLAGKGLRRTTDEKALAFSEARYRALFEENPTMITTVDQELKLISLNPSCASQLGYSVEELEGQPVLVLFQERDRAAVADQLHKCLGNPKKVYHWQFPKVRKDGGMLWVEETAQAVHDLNGELNILLVCQDISDRKRAEQEREQLLLQLEAVLENITEGVLICDMQGKVVKMNQEALRMHGLEREIGVPEFEEIFEVTDVAGDGIPLEQLPLFRALRGERFTDVELHIKRRDTGKSFVGSYSGRPVPNQTGDIILYVITMRDVTERKRVREELQRDKEWLEKIVAERTDDLQQTIITLRDEVQERILMQEKLEAETAERRHMQKELREKEVLLLHQSRLAAMGDMIGNIAHQWRQPLNMLALVAQDLLMTFKIGSGDTRYLESSVRKMMETINHMSKTIDDFRNFFRPDKQKTGFRVLEMVEKTLSLLEVTLKAQQIATMLEASSDPVVHGYPSEYSQVLLNIIGNARDALVSKQVEAPCIVIEVGSDGGRSVVTITDNAGGIPEEILDKIFDPYFTTKGPDKGTGVGLYMSKIIIEKNMGGRLSVRNTTAGAQFRVEV